MFLEVFLFMDPKIWLEIFGYIGTALVLVSFLMHDIKWLRAVNMAGGAISLIYAIIMNTMPVVVLNGSLILINGVQLARILRREREMKKEKETSTNEADN
jgi:membrane-bound ClpP family serine protease